MDILKDPSGWASLVVLVIAPTLAPRNKAWHTELSSMTWHQLLGSTTTVLGDLGTLLP